MKKNIVTIQDQDNLLRRVPFIDPNYVRDDGTLTSLAFSLKRRDDGISVNIERLTTYKKSILNVNRFRLYYLKAKVPRDLGLRCVHEPDYVNNNYAHALLKGKINRPLSKKLSAAARRINYPSD
jgi:hypothetical protein